jgi:FixJ family two-component response regulator
MRRNAALPDPPPPIVHVVEDDASARRAVARLLQASGYTVRTFATAAEFLDALTPGVPGCALLDLRLPGSSGLDVQEALKRAGDPLPVIFITGHGQVADSVRAMKSGAVDFLSKSADGEQLLDAVSRALARSAEEHRRRTLEDDLRRRYDRLSPRERQVFAHLISGQLNKQVGFDLGISVQTTKIHRHRVFAKLEADSIAHLVRIGDALGIAPLGSVR